MVAEAKAALRRSVSTYDSRPAKRERRNSDSTDRRQTIVIKRKVERPKPEIIEPKETKSTDKNLR